MKRAFIFGCSGLLLLGGMIAVGLFILAWKAMPLPGTTEAMASLPEGERNALQAICEAAGLQPSSLRHIGAWSDDLFEHQSNATSFVVRDGHLAALCLRGVAFKSTPDFAPCTALQSLWLKASTLPEWPDFSKLTSLTDLNLAATSLADPASAKLPPTVQTLSLDQTGLSRLDALASLKDLRVLSASGTQVTSFDPLLGLALDKLNLLGTRVATLPAAVPAKGAWELSLEGTPFASPAGYASTLPGGGNISRNEKSDQIQGSVTKEKVEGQGRITQLSQRRRVELPRGIIPGASPVTLEVSIASGKARIWLREPPEMFQSPWLDRGKVKGFSLLRQVGWVSQEVGSDKPATLRGKLDLVSTDRYYEVPADVRKQPGYVRPPNWCDHSFIIEPIDGSTASDVTFKISSSP